MIETENIKTASLKINTELHQRLKIDAAQKGIKMQALAEKALEKSLTQPSKRTRAKSLPNN